MVFAECATRGDFLRIFSDCCRQRSLAYDQALVERLLDEYFQPKGITMRGCHPRDLIEQALAQADYMDEPRHLTYPLLEAACAGYFVDDAE